MLSLVKGMQKNTFWRIKMNKLKTLKDIIPANEFDRNKFSVRQGIQKLYSEQELRQAAVEWIMEYRNIYNNMLSEDAKKDRFVLGKAEGLKEFFNISEDNFDFE